MSLSTNVSNLATRIATEVKALRTLVNGNAADLSALSTTAKANLVLAINEIKSALDTAASDINSLETSVGTLSSLTTTAKSDLVSAINELQSEIDGISFEDLNNATSDNTPNTLVKRDLSGGFSAGAVTASSIVTHTIDGAAGGLNIATGLDSFVVQAGSADITTYSGDIVLNASGNTYIDSATAENEVATIGDIDSAIAALVDGAPALLDTLNELAAAINDDASFASTITTAIATKADDSAVVKLTGSQSIDGIKTFTSAPVVPDDSFTIAKTAGLQAALDSKASTANVGDTTVNYVTTFEAGLV